MSAHPTSPDRDDLGEESRSERRWHARQHLPLFVVLIVLWTLLWGDVSWLNLLTGLVFAVAVSRVFYLPTVELTGRLDPVRFVVLFGAFVGALVAASFQVAWLAFRGVQRNSVVAVRLRSRSDLMTTLTAVAISLIPGSIVVEVDRTESVLYLHVLDADDERKIERARETVLRMERRIVRALGSRGDLRRLSS